MDKLPKKKFKVDQKVVLTDSGITAKILQIVWDKETEQYKYLCWTANRKEFVYSEDLMAAIP